MRKRSGQRARVVIGLMAFWAAVLGLSVAVRLRLVAPTRSFRPGEIPSVAAVSRRGAGGADRESAAATARSWEEWRNTPATYDQQAAELILRAYGPVLERGKQAARGRPTAGPDGH